MNCRKTLSLIAIFFLSLLVSQKCSSQNPKIEERFRDAEYRQFDFWLGSWDVNLRMIQKDLTWKDSVRAKVQIYSILDGKAVLELWDSKPIKGFSLRYYDPASKKWILYLCWPSPQYSAISSLKGTFCHGRGEFFSKNKGTISRYTFCDITSKSLRWDDAFSKDGGRTWTNNWIMEFSRTARSAQFPELGEKALTYETGRRSTHDESRLFEQLNGLWKSKSADRQNLNDAKSKQHSVTTLRSYKILDGCAVMSFLHSPKENDLREFSLVTFNPKTNKFQELILNNRKGSSAQKLTGSIEASKVSLLAEKKFQRTWEFKKNSATMYHFVWNDRINKYLLTRGYEFEPDK